MTFIVDKLLKEVTYKATTSGGKGGQNVNKVATRVELCFEINESVLLDGDQKIQLLKKLKSKITEEGKLRLICSEARTQLGNKKLVQEKFITLITAALKKPKARKPTRKPTAAIEERIKDKKKLSEKKNLRSRIS